ncbi:MAG: hypothetical protein H8K07_13500 [Nitrospira sp.]|nr:hypothetical protein [Nitrospira sp.]MDI3463131.1 hypothetical protein [Nitrospira sp.]
MQKRCVSMNLYMRNLYLLVFRQAGIERRYGARLFNKWGRFWSVHGVGEQI